MEDLRQKILDENVKLHRIEAPHYDVLHPEEFNWFEQGNMNRDIGILKKYSLEGKSALDIGCGTGNILLKLLPLGVRARGLDISAEMIEALKLKIPSEFKEKVDLVVKDIDSFLDSCQQKFDLVTISSVLHHLPDYVATLGRITQLLNKDGLLYITHEPTKLALGKDRFLRKILWQLDYGAYLLVNQKGKPDLEGLNYHFSDYQLYHGFDEEKVIDECKRQGLSIVQLRRYSSTMRFGLTCWIDSKLLGTKSQFALIVRRS